MSSDYIYAVARVRHKELSLLTRSDMESLLSAKTYKDCLHILSDKGWGEEGEESSETILSAEREKTWQFIGELVRDTSEFNVFLLANDYHNLKAAIKEAAQNKASPDVYIPKEQCTIDPEDIKKAILEREYGNLPEDMREAAKEALETLLHTGDSQLCDVIIDAAALSAIYKAGSKSKDDALKNYAEITVAAADIKTAVRSCRMGKDQAFILKALAPCDSLDVSRLSKAAADSIESVYEYLEHSDYSSAVPELMRSSSAFERWCDDELINGLKPQLHNPFSIGPLAAYIAARDNEIKSVRIILSGKLNGLDDELIRERVRETYV